MTTTYSAEELLVGAMLLDDEVRQGAYAKGITPSVFQATNIQQLMTVVREMDDLGLPVEAVAIRNYAARSGHDILTSWVADLRMAALENPQVSRSYQYYCEMVLENERRVRAVKAAQSVIEKFQRDPTLDIQGELAQALLAMQDPPHEKRGGWMAELLPDYLAEVEATWAGQDTPNFVPTGITGLDSLLRGGMRPGELVIVGARSGMGKALALDTPIPTPDGWTTMGDLKAGDTVFDETGTPCKVTYATPIQYDRTCYRVVFSDGSEIVADADHRWLTSTLKSRKSENAARHVTHESKYARDQTHKRTYPSVVTTKEILDTLRVGPDDCVNHAIDVAKPLMTVTTTLPIKPYTLGAWLGDGDKNGGRISNPDEEVWDRIRDDGCEVGHNIGGDNRCETRTVYGLKVQLRDLGLLGNKHIPSLYLRASVHDRKALLGGLLDTDGTVQKNGTVIFGSKTKPLADGVYELVCSLGMQARRSTKQAKLNGKDYGTYYKVTFRPTEQFFTVKRKAERIQPYGRATNNLRYIVDVTPTESVPVRCITVDSPSHLYLAGESMIPTHNTAFALQLATNAARRGKRVVIFSAEQTAPALLRRASAGFTGVPATLIDKFGPAGHPNLERQRQGYLHSVRQEMIHLPIYIDDTSRPTVAYMMDKARRLGDIDFVIFDYLGLANDGLNANASPNEKMSKVANDLMMMAKELRIPVLALSQLNRSVEQQKPYVPSLSNLRDSGQIEANAHIVLLLYRKRYYQMQGMLEDDGEEGDYLDIYISKNREGANGMVRTRFDGPTFSIRDV